MTSDRSDLGNQALIKVAEIGITSQLDTVEKIEVDIRTDAGKLIQGKVDSVVISGQGLVMTIFEQLLALLDLRNFEIPGMSFQLHQLEAQVGKLVIHAKAQVAQIPSL